MLFANAIATLSHRNHITTRKADLLLCCRIGLRPKRVGWKSSNPFQRRKQRNGRIHSLYYTLILFYIDITTFTVQGNTGSTSVSDLNNRYK
ncbi:hypothetical protein Hanom_Chr08g00728611 [Helianthus anomalus]